MAFALVGTLSVGLRATTLLPADLGELSRDARVIVRGQVVSLDATWTADHRGIETLVTLQSEAYLKGQFGSSVQFRIPGGRLGRFQSIMVGAPQFVVGQHVIVFLGTRGPSVPYVLGLSQGVFRLAKGSTGWLVTPPAILAAGHQGPIVRGDLSRRPLPLADFERQVRLLSAAEATR